MPPPFFSGMNNSYRQSLYIAMIRILANIIMVGAIFLAMYTASRWSSWPAEATFCLVFFGITIPVWALAWTLGRLVRRHFPAPAQSLVNLPRLGSQLVAWHVIKPPRPPRLRSSAGNH